MSKSEISSQTIFISRDTNFLYRNCHQIKFRLQHFQHPFNISVAFRFLFSDNFLTNCPIILLTTKIHNDRSKLWFAIIVKAEVDLTYLPSEENLFNMRDELLEICFAATRRFQFSWKEAYSIVELLNIV